MTTKDNIENEENVGFDLQERFRQRHDPERCFPEQPESCELTLRCRRSDYSASAIARAVEDCDAHLLNLNVTSLASADDPQELFVDLRVNLRSVEAVERSLQRYGYEVVEVAGADGDAATNETLRQRLDLLLLNLEI